MRAVTLQPEDLRDAKYQTGPDPTRGACVLRVTAGRKVLQPSASLYPSDLSAGAATSDDVVIQCDTEVHRAALMAELQRFAGRR